MTAIIKYYCTLRILLCNNKLNYYEKISINPIGHGNSKFLRQGKEARGR